MRVRRVFAQDEYARVALCENQQWLPLVVLVGLVGCSVPVQLKAEVFKTLAALARTPDIAATLWQSIEVSQVRAVLCAYSCNVKAQPCTWSCVSI